MTENHDVPVGYPADSPPMTMLQARMLDLRSYICALFVIFGLTVTLEGVFVTQAELDKAAGVNINLYAGIAMLMLAAVMGVWAFLVPPEVPSPTADPDALTPTE
jgi:hypothetical protein